MDNPYRDMKDIKLTCHLVRNFEEIFGYKIYEVIKQKNNIFSDIKADYLMLWKIQIPNDDKNRFSSLELQKDEKKANQQMANLAINQDNDLYGIRLWKVEVSFENKAIFDNLKNNKEASAIRIMLNGEEQYRLEKIENTFGNPPKTITILSFKRGLDNHLNYMKSDFHINNVNNENAGENGPEYGNKDEGDSSPTESEFVENLKNVHKYIDMDESGYNW
ncbi:3460_t:CDS:2 [Funneliformis geosporum]|nr:3460_t:CDS:2 [Funneliformis geosporum]